MKYLVTFQKQKLKKLKINYIESGGLMNNDISTTITKLLSDNESSKLIGSILGSLKEDKSNKTDTAKQDNANALENTKSNNNKKVEEIQRKTEILTALIPLFDEENKIKIQKIINAMNIIKTFLDLL